MTSAIPWFSWKQSGLLILAMTFVGCSQSSVDENETANQSSNPSSGEKVVESQQDSLQTQASPAVPSQPLLSRQSEATEATKVQPTTFQDDFDAHAFERLELAKKYLPAQSQALQLAAIGRFADSRQLLERLVKEAPFLPAVRYNYACFLVQSNDIEGAYSHLEAAIQLGFIDFQQIEQDEDFRPLRGTDRFRQLLAFAEDRATNYEASFHAKQPAVVENQIALIGPESAVYDAKFNFVRTFVDWTQEPTFGENVPVKDHGEVGELLRRWYREGTAAGNWGDLYDNCDRNHSRHPHQQFPTSTRINYEKSIRGSIPYGPQTVLIHNGNVIGNSSTAATGNALWRSNTRRGYANAASALRMSKLYSTNHLYLYPEHTDYDLKHGDVFPSNTPYVITSNGSSGSDRPFMDALFCALAAFHPDVKQRLSDEKLIAPTLQWVFRTSNKNVSTPDDYLTRKAHPPIFDSKQLDTLKMIEIAHDLKEDEIPPLVVLKAEEEDQGNLGVDYFDVGPRTTLFDSPQAIARVYRTLQPSTRIVVSAAESFDCNDRPLKFEWVVFLEGDKPVQIKPLDADKSRVEITIPYTPKHSIGTSSRLETCRVEIGVFAHNGKHYSAPAFVTYLTLANEKRKYSSSGRLQSVDYHGGTDEGTYTDPIIDAPKTWLDEYVYSDSGELLGWTREIEKRVDEFTRHGFLVKEKDALGRPIKAVAVRYHAIPKELRPMIRLGYEPTDNQFEYTYQDDDDKLGQVKVD